MAGQQSRGLVRKIRVSVQMIRRRGPQFLRAMQMDRRHLVSLLLDVPGRLLDKRAAAAHHQMVETILAPDSSVTMVVIPGWDQMKPALYQMAQRLHELTGYSVLMPHTHQRGNVCTYHQMREANASLMKTLAERRQAVVLIGYSRGGQNAIDFAEMLIQEGLDPGLISIISVATPWKGSPLAFFTYMPGGREMVIGSPALHTHQQQRDRLLKAGVQMRHFRFWLDGVAPPGTCHEDAEVLYATFCHYCIHAPWVWEKIAAAVKELTALMQSTEAIPPTKETLRA